jgi:hypothetical protein
MSRRRPHLACWRLSLVLSLFALIGLSSGCGEALLAPGEQYWPTHPVFSPDSLTVAYVHIVSGGGFGGPVQPMTIRWRNLREPLAEHKLSTLARITDQRGNATIDLLMEFSPDSKHLAVVSPFQMEIVDLAAAKSRRQSMADELVTSCAWQTDHTIGYCSHTHRHGRVPESSTRSFYIQDLDDSPGQRRLVWREERVEAGNELFEWPLERWSPNGRCVVLASPYEHGLFRLLDMRSGQLRDIGPCDGYSSQVSWKPDSSMLACVAGRWPVRAWLVQPSTGERRDFSGPFRGQFGDYPPLLEPRWTADGEYLLVNSDSLGGCLVRPEPWQVIELRARLAHLFEPEKHRSTWPSGAVHALPLPGWVAFWGPGALYAINYGTTRLVKLDEDAWEGWAVSPDARWIVTVRSLAGCTDDSWRRPVQLTFTASGPSTSTENGP